MKTVFFAMAFMFVLASATDVNAQVVGTRQKCFDGNLKVKNQADWDFLRSQRCVNGSVVIQGAFWVDDDVMETLDLGKLAEVKGILYINGCQRLKFIGPTVLKKVFWLVMTNNPMLSKCKVLDLAADIGAEFAVDASMNHQDICD